MRTRDFGNAHIVEDEPQLVAFGRDFLLHTARLSDHETFGFGDGKP